jgi:hypothetical protein
VAVLNQPNSDNPQCYDLSFMFTRRCNLRCPFCMYDSGPEVTDELDLDKLKTWLVTVDPNRIASLGLYGGEPSIDMKGFGRSMILARRILGHKPGFVISNGAWSKDKELTRQFLFFCQAHELFLVVSGTVWHRMYQDREVLENLAAEYPNCIRLKPVEENYQAMGRLEGKLRFTCSQKCQSWNRALRIAVQPDGNIIFQNCDGVYPVAGSINEDFAALDKRIMRMRGEGFGPVCRHYPKALVAA